MASMESTSLFAIKFAREIREDGNPIAMLEARDAAIRAEEAQKCAERAVALRVKTCWPNGDHLECDFCFRCDQLRLAIMQGQQEGAQK